MKKKLIIIGILLLVAAVTGVTFAQAVATSSIGVSTAGVKGAFVEAKTASAAGFSNLRWTQNPTWSPIENAAGNIAAGDVYHIDSSSYTGDIVVTLYLTNAAQLMADYSYLGLNLNAYTRGPTEVTVSGTPETFTGNGSTKQFTLAYKPVKTASETVTVTQPVTTTQVAGASADYTMNYSTGLITFNSGKAPATGTDNVSVTYTSAVNGTRQTQTFSGDASTLTFQLTTASVAPNSETITVTASATTIQVKGTDYTLAYDTGVITFTTAPAAPVAPATTDISVTYTYYTYSGWTVVTAETLASGASTITAGTTYTLTHNVSTSEAPAIRVGTEAIKNGTTTLTKGTDYSIDYDTGVITTLKSITVVATEKLTADYSYGGWNQATLADGSAIGTVYLSLQNGYASFILAGNRYYDITINGGFFYTINTTVDATHNLSPAFYLDVRQA